MGLTQSQFGGFARDAFGTQIHQHHMAFSAATDDAQSPLNQGFGQGVCVQQNLLLIGFEGWLQGLMKSGGLACNDMHQWAALHAWEDRAVDFFRHLFTVGQDDAAAGAAQTLMGR